MSNLYNLGLTGSSQPAIYANQKDESTTLLPPRLDVRTALSVPIATAGRRYGAGRRFGAGRRYEHGSALSKKISRFLSTYFVIVSANLKRKYLTPGPLDDWTIGDDSHNVLYCDRLGHIIAES